MNAQNQVTFQLVGADLEKWRLENGLSKSQAADIFGLQKVKWEELTVLQASEVIQDPPTAMMLYLYKKHPESSPVQPLPDIAEFYKFLGFKDTPQDRETFATLIGRSAPSVYRLLLHSGNPSRQVIKWIEAVKRLKLTPKQTLKLMADVVDEVSRAQNLNANVTKVLLQSQVWSK